jgi:hypothetical protein
MPPEKPIRKRAQIPTEYAERTIEPNVVYSRVLPPDRGDDGPQLQLYETASQAFHDHQKKRLDAEGRDVVAVYEFIGFAVVRETKQVTAEMIYP